MSIHETRLSGQMGATAGKGGRMLFIIRYGEVNRNLLGYSNWSFLSFTGGCRVLYVRKIKSK